MRMTRAHMFFSTILSKYKMKESKPVSTPIERNHNLFERDELEEKFECPYREAIGSLLYLAKNTRPDILYAVILLARFTANPRRRHWEGVKRVLRYLKGTENFGLYYQCTNSKIVAYTDADWGNDREDRKSYTGVMVMFGSAPVLFISRKQPTVALSTTEAEFIAASETLKELIWLKSLLFELNVEVETPVLRIDSQTAIRLVKNPEFHRRTKHIDIKYNFIRDRYGAGEFTLEYTPTENQLADFLTKPLSREVFARLIRECQIVRTPNQT